MFRRSNNYKDVFRASQVSWCQDVIRSTSFLSLSLEKIGISWMFFLRLHHCMVYQAKYVLFPSSWTSFVTIRLYFSTLSVGFNSLFSFREFQSENCPQLFICSQAWVQVSWKWRCVEFFPNTFSLKTFWI